MGVNSDPIPQTHNRFLRFLLGRKIQPIPQERATKMANTNFVNVWTYSWVFPYLRTGYDRVLTLQDIPKFSDKDNTDHMYTTYLAYIDRHGPNKDYVEMWALLYTISPDLIGACVVSAILYASEVASGVIGNRLILEADKVFASGPDTDHGPIVGYIVGFTLLLLLGSFMKFRQSLYGRMLAERTRQLVMTSMQDKMFRVSAQERLDFTVGKITSIITSDSRRLANGIQVFSKVSTTPIQFGGSLGVLIWLLGPVSLVGFGLVLLTLAASFATTNWLADLRDKADPHQDERISLTREAVKNMHILKFYGWEIPFAQMIHAARKKEIFFIRFGLSIDTVVAEILTAVPYFAGLLTFAIKVVVDKRLEAAAAFPALTLFDNFSSSLWAISDALEIITESFVAIKRINSFFRLDDKVSQIELSSDLPNHTRLQMRDCSLGWYIKQDSSDIAVTEKNCSGTTDELRDSHQSVNSNSITIQDGLCSAESLSDQEENKNTMTSITQIDEKSKVSAAVLASSSQETSSVTTANKLTLLHDINCTFERGTINLVMGPVGSGKTTFLNGLLDLCPKFKGHILQQSNLKVFSVLTNWNQSGKIRDNILFGREYDRPLYGKIVKICDLQSDFQLFDNGDMTDIGENGLSLSGGQRARLALARCLYTDGDVYVLDDVLSAMDAKVGAYIFKEFVKLAHNEGKTIIMSTNNKALVGRADTVVSLDGDGSAVQGRPDKVQLNFVSTATKDEDTKQQDETEEIQAQIVHETQKLKIETEGADKFLIPTRSAAAQSYVSIDPANLVDIKNYQEEEKAIGSVKNSVIYNFLRLGEWKGIALFLITLIAAMGIGTTLGLMSVFMNWWISDDFHESQGWYIGLYAVVISAHSLSIMIVTCALVIYTTRSSTILFQEALDGVMRAPMSFFQSNPLGRIMTRFTENLTNIDTELMVNLKWSVVLLSFFLGTSITVFVFVPWALLCLILIIAIMGIAAAFYRDPSRDLNRCRQLYESVFYARVSENIEGQAVLVTYNQQENTTNSLMENSDDVLSSVFISFGAICWVGLRADLSTNILTFVTLMLAAFNVYKLSASEVGMLISLFPMVTTSVSFFLPRVTNFENEMNSVERLNEYAHELENEYEGTHEDPKLRDWTVGQGTVTFDNVSLRYRPELPLVLRNLTFEIAGGKSLGICGRTGAGKSTIISALFRFVPLADGDIRIDGASNQAIPLNRLRQVLSIIPQEPVLFQGTIRSNLDPFHQKADADLWDALNNTGGLTERDGKKFHLDSPVDAEGSNFSLGERQMLALARALVRNSKILILDEATANVDEDTDERIQHTIRTQFKDSTVITIAHRIKTILDYDEVMVMGPGGVLLEKGPPMELLKRNGEFAALVNESKSMGSL